MIMLLTALSLAQSNPTGTYTDYVRGMLDGIRNPEAWATSDTPQLTEAVLDRIVAACRLEQTTQANCLVAGGVRGRRRELAYQAAGAGADEAARAHFCATYEAAATLAEEASALTEMTDEERAAFTAQQARNERLHQRLCNPR